MTMALAHFPASLHPRPTDALWVSLSLSIALSLRTLFGDVTPRPTLTREPFYPHRVDWSPSSLSFSLSLDNLTPSMLHCGVYSLKEKSYSLPSLIRDNYTIPTNVYVERQIIRWGNFVHVVVKQLYSMGLLSARVSPTRIKNTPPNVECQAVLPLSFYLRLVWLS